MAVQVGAQYLEKPNGGRGILLGGVPGVAPANVLVLGGGVVGHNAIKMACGLGANVTVIDRNINRLRELDDIYSSAILTLASNTYTIREAVRTADLVIGAVLIPGASAPRLVRRDMIASMRDVSKPRTPPRIPTRSITSIACCTTAFRTCPPPCPIPLRLR
jgi:alanine dehydrogenase